MADQKTTKAPANYDRLAEDAELIHAGLTAKLGKVKAQLNAMLKDIPERAAIMQSFERMADLSARHRDASAKLDRYVALRDRPTDPPADPPASS